jgi:hypothetical protein
VTEKTKGKIISAEMDQRINYVAMLILKGISSRYEILQIASKLDWKVSNRQIDTYMARARMMIQDLAREDREFELAKSLGRHDLLFNKSLHQNDYRTALEIEKSRAKIVGLEIVHVEVKSDNKNHNFSPDLAPIYGSEAFIDYTRKLRNELSTGKSDGVTSSVGEHGKSG